MKFKLLSLPFTPLHPPPTSSFTFASLFIFQQYHMLEIPMHTSTPCPLFSRCLSSSLSLSNASSAPVSPLNLFLPFSHHSGLHIFVNPAWFLLMFYPRVLPSKTSVCNSLPQFLSREHITRIAAITSPGKQSNWGLEALNLSSCLKSKCSTLPPSFLLRFPR